MGTKLQCVYAKHGTTDVFTIEIEPEGGLRPVTVYQGRDIMNSPESVCAFVTEALKQGQAFGRADLQTEFARLMRLGQWV